MASTKAVTVLFNDVTLAPATPQTSALWTLTTGYGGLLNIKVTNGATGPTLAAQAQIQASPDNSHWYNFGGALLAQLGNSIVTSWSIPIPVGVEYLQVVISGNTGQNVTVRAEGAQVTAIS